MRNDWILDVLEDLRSFADQSGMKASAEQLADTCLVVAAELSSTSSDVLPERAGGHEDGITRLSGGSPGG